MKNVYDNGEQVLGQKEYVIEYLIKNAEEMWEVEEIIEYLKTLEEKSIVCINYDNGMGWNVDYWEQDDIIKEIQ